MLRVREACSINQKPFPFNNYSSDGKQSKAAAKDIGDKVQVVIDGTRGITCPLQSIFFLNIYFQTASKQEMRRRKQNCLFNRQHMP